MLIPTKSYSLAMLHLHHTKYSNHAQPQWQTSNFDVLKPFSTFTQYMSVWYVSNVSIIFDCSMLYYLLFWTILGFIIHFYIILGTNLLTGGPTQNCCFLPISEFRGKRISNGVQTEWNLRECDFRNEHDPEDLDPTSRNQTGSHEVGGAPTPWARPPPS